jgi:hypothetical protein
MPVRILAMLSAPARSGRTIAARQARVEAPEEPLPSYLRNEPDSLTMASQRCCATGRKRTLPKTFRPSMKALSIGDLGDALVTTSSRDP